MRLRLATETRSTVIELMGPCVTVTSGINTGTPGMAGAFTYEPYGAQFDFSNFQPIQETLDLAIKGPGRNVLDTLDSIQDFLEKIRLFHDGDLAAESCWLEWSAVGERERRTLLYNGELSVTFDGDVTPMLATCEVIGKLSLTRHPLWENVADSMLTLNNVSTLGGLATYTGLLGNTLARIDNIKITGDAGTTLYRHWVGIRRLNNGMANFESLWELEDGFAAGADPGAAAADVTASPYGAGNTKVTIAYAGTAALSARWQIRVADVCAAAGHADYNHQQGRYLVLCRCKVSGAGTNGIQMRYGYYAWQSQAEEVYVDNTSWRLIPLGNISIPPWRGERYGGNEFLQYFNIAIFAEQLTAGITLDIDCLVLIPNEHMLTLSNTGTAPTRYSCAVTHEDERESAYDMIIAIPYAFDSIESGMTDWYIPPGNGIVVYAAENATIHDATETCDLVLTYLPRWLLYRSDTSAGVA